MQIPTKWELHQTAFNHSLDNYLKDVINPYKKWTGKPYSSLVIDASIASENPSSSKKNLLERIWKLIIS